MEWPPRCPVIEAGRGVGGNKGATTRGRALPRTRLLTPAAEGQGRELPPGAAKAGRSEPRFSLSHQWPADGGGGPALWCWWPRYASSAQLGSACHLDNCRIVACDNPPSRPVWSLKILWVFRAQLASHRLHRNRRISLHLYIGVTSMVCSLVFSLERPTHVFGPQSYSPSQEFCEKHQSRFEHCFAGGHEGGSVSTTLSWPAFRVAHPPAFVLGYLS
jgi:hypothetical protein